jgi:hypothetical protein
MQRSRDRRQWHPAVYRGLTMGASTREEMLQTFGNPQWSGPPQGQMPGDPNPELWYGYEYGGEFPGNLTIATDQSSGVIKAIDLEPQNLTKKEAIEHFGPDYIVTRYDFDLCLGDEESSPLYESPHGSLVNIEYRQLGIAVRIDDDRVLAISYESGPIGAPSSRCKPRRNKSSAASLNR